MAKRSSKNHGSTGNSTRTALAPDAVKAVRTVKLRYAGKSAMIMGVPRAVLEITGWKNGQTLVMTGMPDGTVQVVPAGENQV